MFEKLEILFLNSIRTRKNLLKEIFCAADLTLLNPAKINNFSSQAQLLQHLIRFNAL